jgi:hypothetical protein
VTVEPVVVAVMVATDAGLTAVESLEVATEKLAAV